MENQPISKRESIRRLRKLKTIIRKVPKEQFNMLHVAKRRSCGTVACVLGWAGLDPEFRKLGLKTTITNDICLFNNSIQTQDFFGITELQERELFYLCEGPGNKTERYKAIDKIIQEVKNG